ncbi:hypothetical protein PR202_ga24627 [Eleusine coracana subsp. coracana]|uniref:F-box domain-containing protein n=1 Tax=Eleusine coracana subsp. coracana TaxID=191504 RepID=A0AAV5D8V3_ELECO|nr:hypothetical protein QOZ80_9AG0676630 [Eleusine coracana subsp. coracana]GJN06858.1 hypothetical protein PR202_ga24627 [Eleusine coracana subsp. coracana]
MPQSKKSSAGPGIDFISALPGALLHHVLSFLHAREAVQTCVLARRWRHLWISMPVLRITGRQDHHHKLRRFMDHLLLLRSRSNLDEFILDSAGSTRHDGDNVNLWIRHALFGS